MERPGGCDRDGQPEERSIGMRDRPSPEYVEALRRLSGEEKLRTAFAMYWEARALKAARLREQHPDWTEEEVADSLAARRGRLL